MRTDLGLFVKYYDAAGKLVNAEQSVIAIELESDVDLVNNKNITHPTVRSTIWATEEGKLVKFHGEFSRWEPAQGKAFELLERARKGRDLTRPRW